MIQLPGPSFSPIDNLIAVNEGLYDRLDRQAAELQRRQQVIESQARAMDELRDLYDRQNEALRLLEQGVHQP